MIDERLTTYINSLDTGNKDYLEELEQYAHETYVPGYGGRCKVF